MSEAHIAVLQKRLEQATDPRHRIGLMREIRTERQIIADRLKPTVKRRPAPRLLPPAQPPRRELVPAAPSEQQNYVDAVNVIARIKAIDEKLLELEAEVIAEGRTCGEREWADLARRPDYLTARTLLRDTLERCNAEELLVSRRECLNELSRVFDDYRTQQAIVVGAIRERCAKTRQPTTRASDSEVAERQLVARETSSNLGAALRSSGSIIARAADVVSTSVALTYNVASVGVQGASALLRLMDAGADAVLPAITDGSDSGVRAELVETLPFNEELPRRAIDAPPPRGLLPAPPQELLPAPPQQALVSATAPNQTFSQTIVNNTLNMLVYGANGKLEPQEAATVFGLELAGRPALKAVVVEAEARDVGDVPPDEAVVALSEGVTRLSVDDSDEEVGSLALETYETMAVRRNPRRAARTKF